MKIEFEFDEQKVLDAVVAECAKHIVDKHLPVGLVSNNVVAQVRTEVMESGIIDRRIDEMMQKIEVVLKNRANKQFTPILEEAVRAKTENQTSNNTQPIHKLHDEGRNVRDLMIATLIGYQNELGCREDSEEYQAYQKMLVWVESTFGSMMS